MDLRGSGASGRPLPSLKALSRPVPPEMPCGSRLDPPNIKISDSGGLDLEAWCLDAGCWKDWNGFEEVTEVTAFLGEGIGRTSHRLELQELGGFILEMPISSFFKTKISHTCSWIPLIS